MDDRQNGHLLRFLVSGLGGKHGECALIADREPVLQKRKGQSRMAHDELFLDVRLPAVDNLSS